MPIRHPIVVSTVCLAVVGTIAADLYVRSLGPKAQVRVVHALSTRFNATVQLRSLHLSLLPHPGVQGSQLRVYREGDREGHPFIAIDNFSAHSTLFDLLFQRDKVDVVHLNGLQIHIAPQSRASLGKGIEGGAKGNGSDQQKLGSARKPASIGVQTIVADGTILEIEPKTSGKDPLRFDLYQLTLHSVGLHEAMTFETVMQNAKPPGRIHSRGHFGPWSQDDPRLTPVSGAYSFRNADLGVFRGISGVLASTGSYRGVLERIEVDGHSDVPDFSLVGKGTPVHLQAAFHAIVDGTNGGTVLDPVDASFLHSEFLCRGGITRKPGDKGKTVDLLAETKEARMEDILKLVSGDDEPVLTGATEFKTRIVIPPGHEKVIRKLSLAGTFALSSAQFTSMDVEERLSTLSRRAQGITKDDEAHEPKHLVATDLKGTFRLEGGVAQFSPVLFRIPGADLSLTGSYGLQSQTIDMKGLFRMQAKASQTQDGVKGILLKPIDPLFAKHGAGFELPFTVGGTRKHPLLGVSILHHKFNVK